MEQIKCVKYIEAYSLFLEECPPTKLWVYKAYGYVEKISGGIIIRFVKKVSDDDREDNFVVNGYLIPDEALISEHQIPYLSELSSLIEGVSLDVVWTNIIKVTNTSNLSSSTQATKGILLKNESDYLVIKDPETATLEPFSVQNSNSKPTYIIIPKSLILKININTDHE